LGRPFVFHQVARFQRKKRKERHEKKKETGFLESRFSARRRATPSTASRARSLFANRSGAARI
jgi:hypothetical protein